MNSAAVRPPGFLEAVMEAMSIGVAVVDSEQRLSFMNSAFCASLGLQPDSFPPLPKGEDAVTASGCLGVYGADDPRSPVAEVLAAGRSRWTLNGRTFGLHRRPLPGGGHVVCALEITSPINAQSEMDMQLVRAGAGVMSLRSGLAAFAPKGALLFANSRFAELLALPFDRLRPGISSAELFECLAAHKEFANGAEFLAIQRGIDRSRPTAMRLIRGNGRVIEAFSDPLPTGGWTMTLTDLRLLASAEGQHQHSARLLDSVLEAIPHGICVYNPSRRVAMFNASYTRVMAGAPLQIGDHLEDVVRRRAEAGEYGPGPPDEVFARQMLFDVNLPQARRRRRPNGTMIEVRTQPLPDGSYVSVVADITALTQAEQEVTRRAGDIEVMLANIRHGILLWGADRRLIASNAIAAEMLNLPAGFFAPGRTQEEVLDGMLEYGVWGDREKSRALLQGLRDLDRSRPHSQPLVTHSGRVLEVQSDPTPGGGWVSTYTDVTEAKAAEVAMLHAKEAAEVANQAKTRFLTTMSHELRTPLNAVIGFSDALRREANAPSRIRVAEFAEQIHGSGRQLLDMINTILDLARIEAGRFDFGSDQVNLPRLITAAIRRTDAAAQAGEIALSSELPAGLPLLRGDERRLYQILDHLLSNAVKFTEPGGTVVVAAALDADGSMVVQVRDTGIGIQDGDIERAFEPFTQLDGSLARRFPGSGLGLYMCRTLVAALGGRLTLRSRLGQGTVAELRLPPSHVLRDQPARGG